MPTYEHDNWVLDVDDRVATLTLNRPDEHNTITPDALLELRDITNFISQQPDIWAVIVRGEGAHFSVGVDVSIISQMIDQPRAVYADNLRTLQGCLDAFESLPQPTIAAIRGFCIGGGVILALCCDFRLAARNAKFMLPEVKRGIAVIMGTQRLTRTIGLARTKELTMLGEMITSDTALTYGLVTQVVDNHALDEAAAAFADKFRRLPPRTVSICKRIADEGQTMTLRQSQDLEIALQGNLLDSDDFKEGVQSFFEKRAPKFRGR